MKSTFLLVTIAFLYLLGQNTQAAGFCGNLDFRTLENEGLEQILLLENLSRGVINPLQCGLIGESLKICSSCANEVSEESMQVLRPILGSAAHSDWHAKWHKIRLSADQISDSLFEKLRIEGFVPSTAIKDDFISKYRQSGSLAGENFFYMHRMMIKMVQAELVSTGNPCIDPWKKLPNTIDDISWPVPRRYSSAADKALDQKKLDRYKAQLQKYFDQQFLKRISLNDLGSLLEMELHQNLHEFYRSTPVNSPEAEAQGFEDDLLPVKTSPVNKYFWKIHGLVDEILGEWLASNGYQKIDRNCEGVKSCYQWDGTWVGKYPQFN